MIIARDQIPSVYYDESRDFQLIGRIFESIINYLKTGVDNIENVTDYKNIDPKLVNLLATTLGFESKHNYNVHTLKNVAGAFHDILRYKGTKLAVEKAVAALLNAQGLTNDFEVEARRADKQGNPVRTIEIYISGKVPDIILLKDMFDYILPVSWDYSIIDAAAGSKYNYTTQVINSDNAARAKYASNALNQVHLRESGESGDSPVGVTSLGIIHTDK